MSLFLAIKLARARPLIKSRGSSSISRMVCVLTDGVSQFIGYNSYRTHPLVLKFSKNTDRVCVHCELDAIIKACNYFTKRLGVRRSVSHVRGAISLSGFKLSVARVLADGSPAYAKPCLECQKAIDHFFITDVKWTN